MKLCRMLAEYVKILFFDFCHFFIQRNASTLIHPCRTCCRHYNPVTIVFFRFPIITVILLHPVCSSCKYIQYKPLLGGIIFFWKRYTETREDDHRNNYNKRHMLKRVLMKCFRNTTVDADIDWRRYFNSPSLSPSKSSNLVQRLSLITFN